MASFGTSLRILFCLVVFAATISANHVQAGIILSTTPDQEYLDHAALFPSVGFVEATNSAGEHGFRQSAVLIHPNFALTSVHGLLENDSDIGSAYTNVHLGFGSNFNTDRHDVKAITAFDLHPTYTSFGNGLDLALLYFEDAFISVPSVNLFSGDPTTTRRGDAHIVGYGETGNEITGATGSDGNRRAGVNEVAFLDSNEIGGYFVPADDVFLGRRLGMAYGHGDSDGGMFLLNDGAFELIGINKSSTGIGFLNSDTTAQLIDIDWVNATMASRLSSVPEPSSATLLLLGLATCLCRRRRRTPS